MEVFVKAGDPVKKGQILGHTELDATKYQLDLALFAVKHNANVSALEGQADAWKATREEAEEAVHKHKVDKSRLEWATGMEKFYRGNYEVQLEQLEAERIHCEYWQAQYDNRFFRSPMDGVVSEVRLEIGKQVTFGTHVFTVENNDSYVIPVAVPAELASGVATDGNLPIRAASNGYVSRGTVDSINEDPTSPGRKIIKLLVNDKDFPAKIGSTLMGTKFDVLLPQTPEKTPMNQERPHTAG
jgi:biotin carboxyl carrier protein